MLSVILRKLVGCHPKWHVDEMSKKTVPNLTFKLYVSKFWPFFSPVLGRLGTRPGQQDSKGNSRASLPSASPWDQTLVTKQMCCLKSFFPLSTWKVLKTCKKSLHSLEDNIETWSPTTFSPLLCLSTLCPQYGTKFECLVKEAGETEKWD